MSFDYSSFFLIFLLNGYSDPRHYSILGRVNFVKTVPKINRIFVCCFIY